MWATSKQTTIGNNDRRGFTIVELLIVIVVIGVLAAITIVAFNGVQQRAREATLKNDLSNSAKKMAADNVLNGSYPLSAAAVDGGKGLSSSAGTTYQFQSTGSTYCITGTNGDISFKVSDAASIPSKGGCPGDGIGGIAAVTNIVTNPSFETDTSMWSAVGDQGGPTITRSPTGPTGNFHLAVTKAAPVGSAQVNFIHDGATAGTTYALGFWAWADTPGTVSVQLSRNNTVYTPFITLNPALTATPTYFSASGVAPAGTTQLRLRITPKTDGQLTHYDGFIVTEGATLSAYADGNSPDWKWNGTPNNSTSTGPAQ